MHLWVEQTDGSTLDDGTLFVLPLSLTLTFLTIFCLLQLLNKLQPLFASSSLFKDKDEQPAPQGKKRGGRRGRQERIKMGQGGTLDPLADGVLGRSSSSLAPVLFTLICEPLQ